HARRCSVGRGGVGEEGPGASFGIEEVGAAPKIIGEAVQAHVWIGEPLVALTQIAEAERAVAGGSRRKRREAVAPAEGRGVGEEALEQLRILVVLPGMAVRKDEVAR